MSLHESTYDEVAIQKAKAYSSVLNVPSYRQVDEEDRRLTRN